MSTSNMTYSAGNNVSLTYDMTGIMSPTELGHLAQLSEYYSKRLDDQMKEAIEKGVTFSSIARQINRTEAAVRLKAKRKGWKQPPKIQR